MTYCLISFNNKVHFQQPVTNKEFTKAFAHALQRPAVIPVPSIILNLLFSEERAKVSIKFFQYIFIELRSCMNLSML